MAECQQISESFLNKDGTIIGKPERSLQLHF